MANCRLTPSPARSLRSVSQPIASAIRLRWTACLDRLPQTAMLHHRRVAALYGALRLSIVIFDDEEKIVVYFKQAILRMGVSVTTTAYVLSYLFVVGAGASLAFQAILNANLRAQLGSPWWAGFVSFFVGMLGMLVVAVLTNGPRPSVGRSRIFLGYRGQAVYSVRRL